jgi:20S proteasome alpha/beta subunit
MTVGNVTFKSHLTNDSNRHDLTYILGAKCKDGIVLVGDKRVTRGTGGFEYEDKIFSDISNVVIGASGTVGLFDKFRRDIARVAEAKANIDVGDFIKAAEKMVFDLNTEYRDRTGGGFIDLLVAYGKTRRGELQYITPTGLAESVKRHHVIGSGAPYGAHYLKKLWNDKLTMRQAAVLGCFIIQHIEENELDQGVGIGNDDRPQVWFNATWPSPEEYKVLSPANKIALEVREVSGEELGEIVKSASALHEKLEAALDGISL